MPKNPVGFQMRQTKLKPMVLCVLAIVGLTVAAKFATAQDWPQWLGENRSGVFASEGLVSEFQDGQLPVVWRIPVKMGYAGPAVADGKVYLMDWEHTAEQRSAKEPGTERVLCFNEKDGSLLWEKSYPQIYKISYPFGPRTTCTVEGDRVYALGAMGNLWCLNANDGTEIWSTNFLAGLAKEAPFWGYAAHPLIDGKQLICTVGGEGNALVSFDKWTGEILWKTGTVKEIGYAPPVIYEAGGKRQLIFWHDFGLMSVDPSNGKSLWTTKFADPAKAQGPAVTIGTPQIFEDKLIVSDFYSGSLVLDLKPTSEGKQPAVVWVDDPQDQEHAEGLNALMATPFVSDGYVYGVSGMGEMRCLDLATGKIKWQSFDPQEGKKALFATTFVVKNGPHYWLFNDQGELILANLTPEGYQQLGLQQVLKPLSRARGRIVVWSHPAYANGKMFARNDEEMVCIDLREAAKLAQPVKFQSQSSAEKIEIDQ